MNRLLPAPALALIAAALMIGGITCGETTAFAAGAVQIGQPAPEFTATDSKGAPVSLSQYRGKVVVLEWTNADCPYTHKHYASGNMQSLQSLAQ
jgi:cytochrome oxidase Cu insertion factor (SCO1/SenC/PrrC family)